MKSSFIPELAQQTYFVFYPWAVTFFFVCKLSLSNAPVQV